MSWFGSTGWFSYFSWAGPEKRFGCCTALCSLSRSVLGEFEAAPFKLNREMDGKALSRSVGRILLLCFRGCQQTSWGMLSNNACVHPLPWLCYSCCGLDPCSFKISKATQLNNTPCGHVCISEFHFVHSLVFSFPPTMATVAKHDNLNTLWCRPRPMIPFTSEQQQSAFAMNLFLSYRSCHVLSYFLDLRSAGYPWYSGMWCSIQHVFC